MYAKFKSERITQRITDSVYPTSWSIDIIYFIARK